LVDGMVADTGGALLPQGLLVRELVCREGRVRARVRFDPRRGWAGEGPRVERWHERLVCRWRRVVATLACAPDLELRLGTDRWIELAAGRRLLVVLSLDDGGPATLPHPDDARRRLDETDRWWRRWSSDLRVPPGDAAKPVRRSLITLRLLTYSPSGAPVAAPTTSLPEVAGGSANWDYRAAWVRDASMGTTAFLSAGCTTEPRSFLWWMLHASRRTRPQLRAVFDLAGGLGHRRAGAPRPARLSWGASRARG
jgi:GH15 family glucan-1,4-alpha-glucosidase